MVSSYNLFLYQSMFIKNVYKYIFKLAIVINQFSRQLTTKFLIKIFFIKFSIVPKNNFFSFCFEKVLLKADSTNLWQSEKPVNKVLQELNRLFVRIKLMQLSLNGFLQQVGSSLRLLTSRRNRKSSKCFSPS